MKVCSGKTVYTALEKAVESGKKAISSFQPERQITELPRFSSPEMAMARAQNKVVIHEAKVPKTFKFPKAEPADLKRLTDNTIEASYSRATWTNPKDGKIYHILKEAKLDNGNISVRILNEDGSFLKNAEITPKKIIVIDDFTVNQSSIYGLTHGDVVTTYLRRNNPFAEIETIDTGLAYPLEKEFIQPFEQVLQRIKSGEKIDYVTCSKGGICYSSIKTARGKNPHFKPISDIADSGTRVLFASGNDLTYVKDATNQVLLFADKAEGVGSLSFRTGRVSDFSASRNSFFTQHYEVGEHYVRPTEYGANITGIPGTDIVITSPKYRQEVEHNFLIGKSIERVYKLLKKIDSEINEVLKMKYQHHKGKIDFDAIKKLDERQEILRQRKNKLLQMKNLTKLENGNYEAQEKFFGTSFAAPVRTARLALTDSLSKVIE